MKSNMAQIAVPVRPFPELQWTMITFSGSAVYTNSTPWSDHHLVKVVSILTLEPFVAFFSDLIQEGEGRPVMVRPMVVGHASAKISIAVIRGAL